MTDPRIEKIARALAMLNVESDDNWKLYIQDAEAALSAIGQMWQPIETAPKDGTKIDVWMHPHGYREVGVFWSSIQDAWCKDSQYEDEPTPLSIFPSTSKWMPLPEAPEIANA